MTVQPKTVKYHNGTMTQGPVATHGNFLPEPPALCPALKAAHLPAQPTSPGWLSHSHGLAAQAGGEEQEFRNSPLLLPGGLCQHRGIRGPRGAVTPGPLILLHWSRCTPPQNTDLHVLHSCQSGQLPFYTHTSVRSWGWSDTKRVHCSLQGQICWHDADVSYAATLICLQKYVSFLQAPAEISLSRGLPPARCYFRSVGVCACARRGKGIASCRGLQEGDCSRRTAEMKSLNEAEK